MDHTVARARWRLILRSYLQWAGRCLLAGVIAGFLFFLADRLAALPAPLWVLGAIASIVLIAPVILAWRARPTPQHAAARIDQALGLKDRVATALFVRPRSPNDPFAQHVVQEAHTVTENLRLRDHFPLQLRRCWSYAALAAGLWLLLTYLLPQMDLLGMDRRRHERQVAQHQTDAAEQQLQETKQVIQRVVVTTDAKDRKPQDDPTDRALDALTKATQPDLSTPEARRKAAAELSEAQQSLAEKAREKERQLDQTQNVLSRLDPKIAGPADRFVEAVRQGDFQAAQEAARQLADAMRDLPPDQRQALEKQLDNLAQQLEEAARDQQRRQQQAHQDIQNSLHNAGLDQKQIDQAIPKGSQQELEEYLKQQGLSPQDARELARKISQARQESQDRQQTGQMCESLGSAMRDLQQAAGDPSGQQNRPMANGSQTGTGDADDLQQSLDQIAKMQQQMRDLEAARQRNQQAISQLADGTGLPKDGEFVPTDGGGVGGSKAGTADGGEPLGDYRRMHDAQSQAVDDTTGQGQGRVIAWWLENGQMDAADPDVTYDQALNDARQDAEQAVNEDRVPKRYHDAIRQYFNQLPQTPSEAAGPPPAPH